MIAFAVQAAATSPVCPIYLINGAFAEYIFTPGNATFDIDSHGAKYHYWGSANKKKIPWTAMDDAAASAIEILSNGEGILDGRDGVFQFQSGSNTFDELAQIYEKATGTKVEAVCDGSTELDTALDAARKEPGQGRFWKYHLMAWSRITIQVLWELENPMSLDYIKRPSTFEEHLKTCFDIE